MDRVSNLLSYFFSICSFIVSTDKVSSFMNRGWGVKYALNRSKNGFNFKNGVMILVFLENVVDFIPVKLKME